MAKCTPWTAAPAPGPPPAGRWNRERMWARALTGRWAAPANRPCWLPPRHSVPAVSPPELAGNPPDAVIFVDTSQDFARGHIPGARWVPRGWLEWQIGDYVPSTAARVVVACGDGRQSLLAATTLRELGYAHAAALDGGMAAWRAAGQPVEEGLAGVMRTPADIVFSGPGPHLRRYAELPAVGNRLGQQVRTRRRRLTPRVAFHFRPCGQIILAHDSLVQAPVRRCRHRLASRQRNPALCSPPASM